MKFLFQLSNHFPHSRFIQVEGDQFICDVVREQEEPTNKNIVAALDQLKTLYFQFADVREKVADQGVAVTNTESLFFNESRIIKVGSFQMQVPSIAELERLIGLFQEKVEAEKLAELADA